MGTFWDKEGMKSGSWEGYLCRDSAQCSLSTEFSLSPKVIFHGVSDVQVSQNQNHLFPSHGSEEPTAFCQGFPSLQEPALHLSLVLLVSARLPAALKSSLFSCGDPPGAAFSKALIS